MPLHPLVLTALAVVLGTGLSPASAKDWTTVTVATEGAYEPWNLTQADGTIVGFEPDLLKDLCGRMKITCKVISADWDGMIGSLNAGKFDVIMDGLSITDDRAKVIAYTQPYAETPAGFIADKTGASANLPGTGNKVTLGADDAGKKVASLEGLRAAVKGKTIGIQTGTSFSDFIDKNFKDVATIREYKTAPEHDLDLAAGRIDLAFDDITYFASALAKPENQGLAFTGPQIAGLIWGPGEAFGMRKSDPDLVAMFDTAVKAAIADGTVSKLSTKWFKVDVTPTP